MATSLPWSVKGVDPRTRDAAKAAARRAGMTLGEWLDNKILEEAAQDEPAPAAEPEQLDIAALSERLARLSQGQMETSSQAAASAAAPQNGSLISREDIDSALAHAATAERLSREASARTAGALDSIARWIEKTEDRLSTAERAAAERQERTTSVIADAIKTMGERLVDVERKTSAAGRQAAQPAPAPSKPADAPRFAFSREGLAAAVTDIRTRQSMLDADEAPAPSRQTAIPESRIAALREDLRELSARIAPAARPVPAPAPVPPHRAEQEAQTNAIQQALAAIDARLDRLDKRDRMEPILTPLARIESEVSRLSQERSGESYQRFELEIGHLAAKVDALASRGADRAMLAPLLSDMAELRSMLSNNAGDTRLENLSQQVSDLSFDVSRLRDVQPDGGELRHLSLAIEDVREAVLSDRSRSAESAPVAALSRQIDALTGKIESMADRQPSRLEDRIDALQQHIEALAETGPAAVMRQIEALSGRIESLTAASQLSARSGTKAGPVVAQVDMRPVEDMLRSLADKIDEAGRPGAEAEAFEALERQISGIAARLDSAAATRSAETGIERTLQDLVVHLQTLRADTTQAAERAARSAMADLTPPASGMAELSNLVTGLRDTHVSAGRQTQDAICAVHQTLETIISRLSSLEAELVSDRQNAARKSTPAPAAAPSPPRAQARLAPQAPVRTSEPVAGISAAAEDRFTAESELPPRLPEATPLPAIDLPLEPGSGRPRAPGQAAAPQDAQSVRQNLIAAARRSAKAATEAAAATPAPAAETAKGGGRLKEIMEKRKRPLLLGLAAVVLAMGTAHVVTGALQGPKAVPAGNETVQEPSAPATAEPAKDQTSALPQQQAAAPIAAPARAASEAAAEVTGSTIQPAPQQAPPLAALPTPPVTSEPVQAVTGIGELPASLGTAGLRKAALAGDARAVYELASRAADGPAATRDQKLALRLFERAAVAGLAPAQFRIGNMFEKGTGTARDISLASVWYTRAAERGNAKAMHNLAVLHAEGVSGKPDYTTATEWFRRAAEYGVRDSQYNLAILLGRGLGAPADLGQSYLWFAVAAGQGDEDAAKKRDEVARRLTPEDLATVKRQAESWRPKALDAAANEVAAPAKGWDETPSAAAAKPARPARS